jgi:hypothetical protein
MTTTSADQGTVATLQQHRDAEFLRRSLASLTGYARRLARGGERRRGRHPPLGYAWAGPDGRAVVEDDEQQATMRDIVRLRDVTGLSWRGIARTLLVAGVEWKRGSEWSESRVRRGYALAKSREYTNCVT